MTVAPPSRPATRQMHLEAAFVRGLLAIFRRIGPVRASNLGGFLCRMVGPRLPVSRIADANLRMAMPELDAAMRRRVIVDMWDNIGRNAGEFPHLATLPRNPGSGPGWDVVGEEYLTAQARRGGPTIFVSGHIGNWEMLPPAVARYGLPFSSFYRAPNNPLVDRILCDLRDAAMGQPVPLFAKGAKGARSALGHILKGGHLGMLVDQKMNDGVAARFFGQPAMTAGAMAAMAIKLRCPVIPGYVERLGPARLRIHVHPPLDLPDSGNRAQDQMDLTQMVNDWIEGTIRLRPGRWLWLHRRWNVHLPKKKPKK
ncbi:LpxL/LpxP family acyltransferase [Komagataeibacter swingsii]|uniref:Lauroyl acyltransferase n=1 Tax=Komagataeibacter swingsii TaxID=215220 RepID=A0A2V4R0U6_9PROT|nr:lauroyl acyltransferase [Komagataeibacter swingsii]PYD70461.1 lauroyl acyltransferase [Komagataeibacter swingsii]GBQ59410.1 lipid A biosynthesis lauroyl acyltransferase [Komagataeibacter swingsii DSM 16373]